MKKERTLAVLQGMCTQHFGKIFSWVVVKALGSESQVLGPNLARVNGNLLRGLEYYLAQNDYLLVEAVLK